MRTLPNHLLFTTDDTQHLAEALVRATAVPLGQWHLRKFPDGETYIRIESDVSQKRVTLLANLHHPDTTALSVWLAAKTLRDLGASHITLIAPYLPYMRQDQRFHPGEGITSHYFSNFIAQAFDELVTLDPHLHRIDSLADVYPVPVHLASASTAIANWLGSMVKEDVFLVGPDAESEQWVGQIARMLNVPFVVFEKERLGDRDIEMETTSLARFAGRRAVLIDDILSTGQTMVVVAKHLQDHGFTDTLCIAIHPVFSDDPTQALKDNGVTQCVSCNTIPHPTNTIDIGETLALAWKSLI